MKPLYFLLLAILFAVPARAQDQLERDPGYVDFAEIGSWFGSEPVMEVNLKGPLLKLAAEASRQNDPETSQLLGRLKAIQVRGFSLSEDRFDSVSEQTNAFAQQLARSGWDVVARVREEREFVQVLMRAGESNVVGMMVIVVEPGEEDAIFVNIVGDIDPAQLGRMGNMFDLDLDSGLGYAPFTPGN